MTAASSLGSPALRALRRGADTPLGAAARAGSASDATPPVLPRPGPVAISRSTFKTFLGDLGHSEQPSTTLGSGSCSPRMKLEAAPKSSLNWS